MLCRFIYAAICALLGVLVRGGHLSAADSELLVLRHEARVARRSGWCGARRPTDRLVLAALSRCVPARDWHVFPVHPATLRRWHREQLRRGRADGERGPGRPPLAPNRRVLIERLARENARWGYRRIRGELLKLGHDVSATAIRMTLRRRGVPPAPRRAALSWPVFLRVQAAGMLAEAAAIGDAFRGQGRALSWLAGARVGRVATGERAATSRPRRWVSTTRGAPPLGSRLALPWSGLDAPGATPEAGGVRGPPAQGQPRRDDIPARLGPGRRPRYPPRADRAGADRSSVRRGQEHRTVETDLRLAA